MMDGADRFGSKARAPAPPAQDGPAIASLFSWLADAPVVGQAGPASQHSGPVPLMPPEEESAAPMRSAPAPVAADRPDELTALAIARLPRSFPAPAMPAPVARAAERQPDHWGLSARWQVPARTISVQVATPVPPGAPAHRPPAARPMPAAVARPIVARPTPARPTFVPPALPPPQARAPATPSSPRPPLAAPVPFTLPELPAEPEFEPDSGLDPAAPLRRARSRTGRRRGRTLLLLLSGAVVVALGCIPAWWLIDRGADIPAIVSGPVLTVVAPVGGKVTEISVRDGDPVTPGATIAVIQADAPDDGSRAALAGQLDDARSRVDRLHDQSGQLQTLLTDLDARPTDPGADRQRTDIRLRLSDLQSQQMAALDDVMRLQRALLQDRDPAGRTQNVIAPETGLVWSMRAQIGQSVVRGLPMAEMVDCAHLFLEPTAGAAASLPLVAGQPVAVLLRGSAGTIRGKVRSPPAPGAATGTEAAGTAPGASAARPGIEVDVDPADLERAAGATCPLGRAAAIHPG